MKSSLPNVFLKRLFDKLKICDSDILLEFIVLYLRLEFSLKKQTRFLKKTKIAQADWNKFIEKIKNNFDKNRNKGLEKAVEYLLKYPAQQQINNNNRLDFEIHPTTSSGSEIERIYHCIRITRNNLFHGGKYSQCSVERAERNIDLLKNSIIVLKEFIKLDQDVNDTFWDI